MCPKGTGPVKFKSDLEDFLTVLMGSHPVNNEDQHCCQVTPDGHSELEPPLPIPNRTVKRLCADDSAATSVKVGHRQATIRKTPGLPVGGFLFSDQVTRGQPHSSQIQNATARMRPTRHSGGLL